MTRGSVFRYLELHDSVLAEMKHHDNECVLVLRPAYIHASSGQVGVDAGEGYWQDLEISLKGVRRVHHTFPLPMRIHDGSLSVASLIHSNLVPVDLRENEVVQLRISPAAPGGILEIDADGIEVIPIGPASETEIFPGKR
ncbi:MAG: hypothetical protein KF715_06455 [Candidatus Didemnitutus sp.]|nr:hypothetical protein [Candidatus Didemnitutus sp.]